LRINIFIIVLFIFDASSRVAQKLKIVNCCGFDCIPADLGAV
jgi:short subunit dehydrogenase-like uncharacterized protein